MREISMKKPARKIIVLCVVLLIGIILGGAGASYFLLNIYSHSLIKQNQIAIRHDIMMPYSLLVLLRKNDKKNAVEILELGLDSGLIGLAHNKVTDDTDRLIVERIREYRTKHPRKNKNPDIEKIIDKLLFPSP